MITLNIIFVAGYEVKIIISLFPNLGVHWNVKLSRVNTRKKIFRVELEIDITLEVVA